MSATTQGKRRPLTPEEHALAHEVAAHITDLRAKGTSWDSTLINVDETWPQLPYRLAIAGLFLAQLTHEQPQQGSLLQ
jgi:hypothetical protein